MDATDPTPELLAVGQGAYVLRVLHAPREAAGRTVVLRDDTLSIGREGPDGLVLTGDSEVSRLHAHVYCAQQPTRFELVDEGSRNGVFVNAVRIARHTLQDGDVVRIGSHLMLFQFVARAALSARRPESELLAMVGNGHRMQALRQQIVAIAGRAEPALVLGETGVGKELVARALHALSGRTGPYVAVNCGALHRELAHSELFGHEAGAFTGSRGSRVGYFEQAAGGTLFLDEIGELDAALQTSLLRVVQENEFARVGDNRMRPVTARIVAATHLALGPALDAGRFREDLYHRLRAYTVEVPPLRARRDDLPGLVQHMLSGTGLVPNVNAWEALLVYAWPGNVRELEQVLREAIPHCRQPVLDLDDLRAELMTPFAGRRPVTTGMPPEAALLDIARDRRPTADEVRRVMAHHNGNIAAVAEFFGKDRKQVHRWLTDYAIDREDYR